MSFLDIKRFKLPLTRSDGLSQGCGKASLPSLLKGTLGVALIGALIIFGSRLTGSALAKSGQPSASQVDGPAGAPSFLWGDVDCSSHVDAVDALGELRSVAQLAVHQAESCPAIGSQALVTTDSGATQRIWGDVDCNGDVSAVDALNILRHVAGLPVNQSGAALTQTQLCPQFGSPVQVSIPPAISAGGGQNCVLTTAGGVKCWGDNLYGGLGNGTSTGPETCVNIVPCSTTAVDVVGLQSGVAAISTNGERYSCALTTVGGVKCWGLNSHGQLGTGASTGPQNCGVPPEGPVPCSTTPVDVVGLQSGVTAITTGWEHACAITIGGGVKCWGDNFAGQLGDGTSTGPETCGLAPNTDACSTTPVDVVGLQSGVIAISAGWAQTCALTAAGGVTCWGVNSHGQLGSGTFTGPQTCRGAPCSTTPVDVAGLQSGVAAVSVGMGQACALTAAGGVKCWGMNGSGALGDGTFTGPQNCDTPPNLTPCSTTPVDVVGLQSGVVAISTGWFRSCVLLAGGALECWGDNAAGQLGVGTSTGPQTCGPNTPCSTTPVDVVGLASGVIAVSVGWYQTCALTAVGGAQCWGENLVGELGDGTSTGPQTCAGNDPCSTTPVDVVGL